MGGSGWISAVLGAVLIIGSSLFGGDGLLYYALLAIGAVVLIFGVMRILRDRAIAADSDPERPLADEVLLRSLARMAYSDTNVDNVEVDTIRRVYKELTGEEVEAPAVRTASRGDLYEATSFDKYLAAVSGKLSDEQRKRIAKALAEVIRADGRHSPLEVEFFNMVTGALKLSPADLADVGVPRDSAPAAD